MLSFDRPSYVMNKSRNKLKLKVDIQQTDVENFHSASRMKSVKLAGWQDEMFLFLKSNFISGVA